MWTKLTICELFFLSLSLSCCFFFFFLFCECVCIFESRGRVMVAWQGQLLWSLCIEAKVGLGGPTAMADVSFAEPQAQWAQWRSQQPWAPSHSASHPSHPSHPSPLRVLVLGSSLLGREIFRELADGGWEVQGLCERPAGGARAPRLGPLWAFVDLASAGATELQSQLQRIQPQAIVNCHTSAALLDLEALESESPENDARSRDCLAFAATLASACEAWRIFLVHVSSNAVFGGGAASAGHPSPSPSASYTVDAEPRPCTPLGWRSLAAEQEVLSRCATHAAVLRVPLLYGPVQSLEECATRASPKLSSRSCPQGPLRFTD